MNPGGERHWPSVTVSIPVPRAEGVDVARRARGRRRRSCRTIASATSREPEHHLDRSRDLPGAHGRRHVPHRSDVLGAGEPGRRSRVRSASCRRACRSTRCRRSTSSMLSHDHYDHTDLPSIEALAQRGTRFVAGLGMGDLVRGAGGEAIELDWWQSTDDRRRARALRAGAALLGPVASAAATGASGPDGSSSDRARRFYHAGDTGYFDGFRRDRRAPRADRSRRDADRRLRSARRSCASCT